MNLLRPHSEPQNVTQLDPMNQWFNGGGVGV